MNPNNRKPTVRGLGNTARDARAKALRSDRNAEFARQQAANARAEIEALRMAQSIRLGVELPDDPLVIDVMALIDVEAGDVWRWRGSRNLNDTPIIRFGQHTLSAIRFIGVALDVISEDFQGTLYPLTDRHDLNPWHREPRMSGVKVGNFKRWAKSA